MFKALAIAALLTVLPPVDDAVTPERFEPMLGADGRLIVQTFRRHPGTVLPFIDGYLEGGLKMIEEGKPATDARTSFRRGLAFAELAAEAFDEPLFVEYAASFASWSPQEQRRFRKGQEEYGLGRRAEAEPRAALAHFETSFRLASRLDDAWGMAMASAGRARMLRELGDRENALRAGATAIELYRRLRMTGSEADVLVAHAKTQQETNARDALRNLRRAWELVEHNRANEKRFRRVLDAYAAALDRDGRRDEADALRRQADESTMPEPAPGP